jgi:hypothetical protein
MKPLMLIAFLIALGAAGCAHQYKIVLNNGTQITASHKPKLEHGFYRFKDINGKEVVIPEGRVQEVGPASMIQDQKAGFKPTRK